MTESKIKYKELCESRNDIPLFLQYWWMEASCGDCWDVLFSYSEDGVISGFLCYLLRRKLGFKAVMPQLLTLYQGVWVLYPEGASPGRCDVIQNEVYRDLSAQLSALGADMYEQSFHYTQFNVEPFIERGFRHSERYTYILDNLNDIDSITANMPDRKRRLLRSQAYRSLTLSLDMGPDEFYEKYRDELHHRGKSIMYSKDYFMSLYNAASDHDAGLILSMKDAAGNTHAALWVVWDSMSAYTEVLYINPLFRNSGASIGVVIEAMKYLKDKTQNFDFAGSMIEAVARRNEMLGGKKVPYVSLQKISSPLLKLWRSFKGGE